MGVTFKDFVGSGTSGVIGIINTVVIPVIFTLVFLVFIWGIVNAFFLNGTNEAERAKGRNLAFWGIFGMVILFSVWGIVYLLLSTLGIAPVA